MPAARRPNDSTSALSSGNLSDRVKILLADDSLTMHRAVSLGLRNEPIDLITCDNGQDALRLTLEHHPRVVLADLDMPGLTGIELLKKIREQDSLSDTKVVLLCSTFDDVDESRINEASADGRLWKPFESHALLALIKTLLASSSGQGRESISEKTATLATPQAVKAAARNLPKAPPRSTPQSAEPTQQMPVDSPSQILQSMPDDTGPIGRQDAKQNLWGAGFESPEDSQSYTSPAYAPPEDTLDLPILMPEDLEEARPTNESSDFEIVTSSFQAIQNSELPSPIDELLNDEQTADSLKPMSEIPEGDEMFRPEGWAQDLDFSTFQQEDSSSGTSTGGQSSSSISMSAGSSGPTEMQIRAWIREEIRDAFDSWLKKNLEDQLARVLDELDESAP